MYGLLLWFVVVNLLLCSNGCMFGEVDFFVDVLDGWCLYWEFVVKCYLCVLVCDGVLFVDFVGFNFVDWFDCKCSWLFDYQLWFGEYDGFVWFGYGVLFDVQMFIKGWLFYLYGVLVFLVFVEIVLDYLCGFWLMYVQWLVWVVVQWDGVVWSVLLRLVWLVLWWVVVDVGFVFELLVCVLVLLFVLVMC